jgi:two-component system chemotaxis sensor kinase CheA
MTAQERLALEESLNRLAASAALLDPASAAEVGGQADALVAWLSAGEAQLPGLARLLPLAQRVAEGMRRGLDSAPGYERLNQVLGQAIGLLEERPSAPDAVPAPDPAYCRINDEDRDSWQDFLLECPELLGRVEEEVLAASRGGSFDGAAILRPLHTLKGICGMLGLAAQSGLMHATEDALAPYRQASALPQGVSQAVLAAMDSLRSQTAGVEAGLKQGGFALLDVSAALAALASAESAVAPEMAAAPPAAESPAADPVARAADNVIRIPVSKMDALLEAVGELAICQAQVTAGIQDLGVQGLLASEAGRLEKISRQLQQVVLGLRMVPVQPLFNRISRQAYDLSQRMGKPLQVELLGGETEVDKSVIEELFEPLLHLVRNALDHGMDLPEERSASGKPEQGRLRLAAFHQGGDFVLQMADDGRGFDLAAIEAKARAQGLLNAAETPDAETLIDLLFNAGFSTAAALTDLSGRGVGLDAVRRRVSDLKGTVTASHEPGLGATFTLRLPLTLALMDAILVRSKGERFALPAAQVLRFLAYDAKARHTVGGGDAWMEAGGRSLSLIDLGAAQDGQSVALHVSAGGNEACLVVDEVLGKQQVVVKALGGLLQNLPGIGGGAVLADGRVGLILDLESLLKERAIA